MSLPTLSQFRLYWGLLTRGVLSRFAVSFSLPYLLYAPYAELGSKVGFIFGSIAAVSICFVYFFVPDCKGRSLEEIDWLFANNIPTKDFASTQVDIYRANSTDLRKEAELQETELQRADSVA